MIQNRENEPSLGDLFKELTDEARALLRQEIELAKAEISEKISRIVRNVLWIAIGGVLAVIALGILLAAACIGAAELLDNFMDHSIAVWLGPLIVGVLIAAAGAILILKAIRTLKNESLKPEKTIASLKENTQWIKNRITSEA